MEKPARKKSRLSAQVKVQTAAETSAPPKNRLSQVKEKLIKLLKQSAKPISDAQLKDVFGEDLGKVVQVMQPLLSAGNLQISKHNEEQYYAWVDEKRAASLRGLTDSQKYVYQIISNHGNRGVHIRDLKYKSSQTLHQLKQILKKLKSKQLIKAINDIDNKTRQIIILFELDPHPDCTGGAWYSESEFDMELIKETRKVVLRLLGSAHRKGVKGLTVSAIAEQLKKSGAFGVDLSIADIMQLMKTMEFDQKVQRVKITKPSEMQDPNDVGQITFALMGRQVHFNFLTQSPCGTCPVFDQCTPGGSVSPSNCPYLEAWLKGASDW